MSEYKPRDKTFSIRVTADEYKLFSEVGAEGIRRVIAAVGQHVAELGNWTLHIEEKKDDVILYKPSKSALKSP